MQKRDEAETASPQLNKDWKYYTGMALLILSVLLPVGALIVVPMLELSTAIAAGIIGAATIGGPEILTLAAIAFLGRDTFNFYKHKVLKLFKIEGPPKPVSKFRYYFGLSIFVGSALPLYLKGLAPDLLPFDDNTQLTIVLISELIGVSSVFIIGGEFWEKLKALFIWDAPAATASPGPQPAT